MQMVNLEPVCAKWGMTIVSSSGSTKTTDKENVINKALGVLAENGFYAMYVFLLSCSQKEYGRAVFNTLLDMLRCNELGLLGSGKKDVDALPDLRAITENLPKLILARRVTDQALTFARYHCKAIAKSGSQGG